MNARIKRLFATDGKCLDVAIDLGVFHEQGFITGLEDIESSVASIIDANPDAIQLSFGQSRLLQQKTGKQKPSLVLRVDASNVYSAETYRFAQLREQAVEQALLVDAACIVTNLFFLPGQAEFFEQGISNIGKLKAKCEDYGMPLMVETVVMKANGQGGYVADGSIQTIVPLVRLAAELGADIIKTNLCDDLNDFSRIIEAASGLPVMPLGGGKASEEEVLQRTFKLMQSGASGLVYGRNVVQHKNPKAITKALMAIVHDNVSAESALALLQQEIANAVTV
ncbi:aldolase [Paenibacillus frigoriresistens]|uniref:class I fructose-bisphosphate aldolase n=1 Tax=Paenibacillus alginolyticus TaxID=59839 RepID=UPI00156586CA|nr:aldolase [Paenibacillus frigoriresistens]NRF94535.1 aldolase [Paenibacillus frigoriresistens]